jgi:hypothetical protein
MTTTGTQPDRQPAGSSLSAAKTNTGAVAESLHALSQPLRDAGYPQMADYVSRAASGLDRWGSLLQNQDVVEAARQIEDFARRRPATFMALAFGAGILAGRFLTSSGYQQTRHYGSFETGPAGPLEVR